MKSCSFMLLIAGSALFWFIWACQYAWLTVGNSKYSSFYQRWFYVFIFIVLLHIVGLIFYVIYRIKQKRLRAQGGKIKESVFTGVWASKELEAQWTGNTMYNKVR